MKRLLPGFLLMLLTSFAYAQENAKIREYKKVFRTYPFSDPDPVPEINKVYPYYRFDGYTNTPVNKEWNVVELENDYIKVMVLPEIGGKIWAAIDKSTNKSFIYYNQVVKFRDVAMRGPWTSGGLEPNYGIVGHTPNCATPVDYTIIKKDDGSVSCVVGVLDLLTRSVWRVDINLQKDKAYFTTSSTWYNASPFEQPYYHWMNGALRAADDLQFVFPGTKYIGHGGEHANWPIDEKGRDLSYYKNNNFGSYKSYHVFGKHTNFWGGYYHNEDFGMARYSGYDDKAGKKIWIWGLSREGMIWDKLLSDDDGQYVEVQSGRLFNQPAEGSSMTPFKNRGFTPYTTDKWTEYWFPVKNTKGLVAASDFGSINVTRQGGKLNIYFLPTQSIDDELRITSGGKQVYSKKLRLKTMELFKDSIQFDGGENFVVELGANKLTYDAAPTAGNLSRPYESPAKFDWNSVQGLHLQGKEFIRQRMYPAAEEKLNAALKVDSNYLPALADVALLMYRQMNYERALSAAKRALAIDAYDPAANYYYGLINERMGRLTDARDGFDIATQSVEFRSAAYTRLATLYYRDSALEKAEQNAFKAIEANLNALDAYQLLALIYRDRKDNKSARNILDSLKKIDPLNHFADYERYAWDKSATSKQQFVAMIRNEMPEQTFLELASWYLNAGRKKDALQVLESAKENEEIIYWKAYLNNTNVDTAKLKPGLTFPFRHETAEILETLLEQNKHWLLRYHLALIRWNSNDLASAKKLFTEIADQPGYAPFYASRAKLFMEDDSTKANRDLVKAASMDPSQWRYSRALINYHLAHANAAEARKVAAAAYKKFPANYVIGMLYAKTLIDNREYAAADALLMKIQVLPNEGATGGRVLYRDAKLMLAAQNIKKGNNKKALELLAASKEWPERLGSGKPYQEEIDERLEDWLMYNVYLNTKNNDSAKQVLNRIVQYTASSGLKRKPSINNYISVMALKQLDKNAEADVYLKKLQEEHPDNKIVKWLMQPSDASNTPPAELTSGEGYRILKESGAIK